MKITKRVFTTILIFCLVTALVFFVTKTSTTIKTDTLPSKYISDESLIKANSQYNLLQKANILTNGKINQEAISLVFEEISDQNTMTKILDVLDTYHVKTTFFVTDNESIEQAQTIQEIINRGHSIEARDTKEGQEERTKEEYIKDFVIVSNAIETTTKKKPTYLRCSNTRQTDILLASAKASCYTTLVAPSKYISYQSFKNITQVQNYAKQLEPGNILAIKTKSVLSTMEYSSKIKVANKKEPITTNEEIKQVDIVQTVSWLLSALQNEKQIISLQTMQELQSSYQEVPVITTVSKKQTISNQEKDFSSYIIQNNNQQVMPITLFYTTQKSVAYTFKGLQNTDLIYKLLDSLDKMEAKATFFVTTKEIQENKELILEISRRGHEIGNGGITSNSSIEQATIQQVCNEIYECHQAIASLGLQTNIYMPANGNSSVNIQRAVSTIKQIPGMEKYELLGNVRSPIISKYTGKTADQIINEYFKEISYLSLRRGDIVYFKMDTKCISDEETIRLVEQVNEQLIKNGRARKLVNKEYQMFSMPLQYQITTIASIQNTYETKQQLGRYQWVNGIGQVYANKVAPRTAYDRISKHFIGNENQSEEYFTDQELSLQIDRTGNINTNQKPVIFLTFDDWAGDPTTNALLDVLDKHQAKASFFIISKNVDIQSDVSNVNPNLLRAIALKGHDIGSHMYNHETLKVSQEEVKASVVNCYQVMHRVIGDLPALQPYFRPPQLLITSYGLQEVMEAGYTYSISGTKSTNDYDKTSAAEILKEMEDQLLKPETKTQGTVFVMHVNDQSAYTAQAVDEFLTKNEQGVYGVKYEIAKISEYLK